MLVRISSFRCSRWAPVGRLLEQRDGHLQPRQRRAQFVAGIGQQRLMRAHQRLDAPGGLVEAGAQRGHFVAPAGIDALAERAGAEALDARLQALEPARQAPHHRVGARGHGREQQQQQGHQRGTARPRRQRCLPLRPGRAAAGPQRAVRAHALHRPAQQPQRAAVVQAHRQAMPIAGHLGGAAQVRLAGTDALALLVVQRQRQAQPLRPLAERIGLLLARGIGRRQRALDQVGPGADALADLRVEAAALGLHFALEQPRRAGGKQRQRHHHREVDAQVERLHPSLPASWRFANR